MVHNEIVLCTDALVNENQVDTLGADTFERSRRALRVQNNCA
jgi:hypothetical protein